MVDNEKPQTNLKNEELYGFALKAIFDDIGAEAVELSNTNVPAKSDTAAYAAREKKENELLALFGKGADGVLKLAQGELSGREYRRLVQAHRVDTHSARGITTTHSRWILKRKEGAEWIEPHIAHTINVNDGIHFRNLKQKGKHKFRLANILDPIKIINPYLQVTDRFSEELKRRAIFYQVQEYVKGHTLYEVIVALSAQPSSRKRDEAIKSLLTRCFNNILYWHQNAPSVSELEKSPHEMKKAYIAGLYDAIRVAREHTNCKLDDRSLEVMAQVAPYFEDQLPNEQHKYTRILDSTLSNIILEDDIVGEITGEELTPEKLEQLYKAIEKGEIIHIDPRERLGHIAEDLFNLVDSPAFTAGEMTHARTFAKDNSRTFWRFLRNHGYDASYSTSETIGVLRNVRGGTLRIDRYAKRAFDTQKTRPNFKEEISMYGDGAMFHYGKAGDHLDNLIEEHSGDTKRIEAYQRFDQHVLQKMEFSEFRF